jgi:hypothetical protein
VTASLAVPVTDADASVQSIPETGPTKWHLAHTTWFFEAIILVPYLRGMNRSMERTTRSAEALARQVAEAIRQERRAGLPCNPSKTDAEREE